MIKAQAPRPDRENLIEQSDSLDPLSSRAAAIAVVSADG
jgi:hypothetical protein